MEKKLFIQSALGVFKHLSMVKSYDGLKSEVRMEKMSKNLILAGLCAVMRTCDTSRVSKFHSCSLFAVDYSLFTVHRSLFIVHQSPFTVHSSPSTLHRPLFIAHFTH